MRSHSIQMLYIKIIHRYELCAKSSVTDITKLKFQEIYGFRKKITEIQKCITVNSLNEIYKKRKKLKVNIKYPQKIIKKKRKQYLLKYRPR